MQTAEFQRSIKPSLAIVLYCCSEVYLKRIGGYLHSSTERGGGTMSDYEIIIVVLTIIAIIVKLLIEYIKNDRPSGKVTVIY